MFIYELDIKNWKELKFFLFRPKTCPVCRRKVYRVDVLPEFSSGWEQNGLGLDYAFKTKEGVRYRCDPCHAYYSLTELANRT
ncbi:MAG: hypothetical protein AB7V26_14950 [Lysobacterales bacterium]